jgi:hypothetical protein
MSGPDQEFEDFLQRRRPLFRREVDDGLEPPAELDRIVLRQARDAIEAERPQRLFRMPRWAAPTAIAATLVLGMSIVFKAGAPVTDKVPQVTVESVAQRMEYPAANLPPPAESEAAAAAETLDASGTVVMDLRAARDMQTQAAPAAADPAGGAAAEQTQRPAAPARSPALARGEVSRSVRMGAPVETAAPVAAAPDTPSWRRDSRSWLAEIERLRASGETERAEAEQAEYNRQNRAYATAPDR